MRCPGCGTDVTEQAVFCHKCGERLDTAAQEFPSGEMPGSEPAAPMPAEPITAQPAPTPTAAEKFKQSAAATQGPADDIESDIWAGGYSPKAMLGDWLLTGLLSAAILVGGIYWAPNGMVWLVLLALIALLWLVQALRLFYRRLGVSYHLTSQRFVHESGILRRVTNRIEAIDIDDVTVEQGVLERLIGVGTIRIISSDRTDPELAMPGINNVREVAGIIDDVRRRERRRRGLHIESI